VVSSRPRTEFILAAVAIVAIAAWLRLWRLDLVEFKNDEANWLRLAEDLVRLGRVPLSGEVSSIGIRNPPDFIYFLAPIVAVTRDPLVASGAIALTNVASVAGTMLLGWRSFSPLVGIIAGLVYATNPWAVFYARKVWNQDIIAPLAVLLFIALERAVIANQIAWAVAAFPIFAVGVQVHASLGVLAPLMLALTAFLLVRRRWKAVALGCSLAGLSTAPYLLFNYKTNWTDLLTLRNTLLQPPKVNADGPNYVIGLATGWRNWSLVSVRLEDLLPGAIVSIPSWIETALLGLGIAVALLLAVGPGFILRQHRLRLGALLLWLILPAVLTIRHGITLYEHYYLFVPPASALLIGIGVEWLASRKLQWVRPVAAVAVISLVGVACVQSLLVQRELDFLATRYAPEYGPPLAQSQQIASELMSFGASSGSTHLVVELAGPDHEMMAYLTRPAFPTLDLIKVGAVGLGSRLASPPTYTTSQAMVRLVAPQPLGLRYADGVEVLAASSKGLVRPTEPASLAISWRIDSPSVAAGGPLVWQVALYDPLGQEIATGTGLQHDLAAGTPGEVILSWFTLETPSDATPGRYQLRLRRLDRPKGQPVSFVARSGETASEWSSAPMDLVRY
jgi:hypothetical protein